MKRMLEKCVCYSQPTVDRCSPSNSTPTGILRLGAMNRETLFSTKRFIGVQHNSMAVGQIPSALCWPALRCTGLLQLDIFSVSAQPQSLAFAGKGELLPKAKGN